MDVRPGGIWRYNSKPKNGDGEEAHCKTIYQEVIEPMRIVYIDSFTDENWCIVDNSEMYTIVTINEVREGSKLTIITRFSNVEDLNNAEKIGMVKGFTAFDRLEEYLILELSQKTEQKLLMKNKEMDQL